MTETELSYIAGLFDGEGYVGIIDRTRSGLTRYIASVVIANQSKVTLDWICESFGGRVHPLKDRRNLRPCYSWYLRGSLMDVFLDAIAPYARIKAKEVEIVRKFRVVVPTSFKEYTPELEQLQKECYETCRWLKKNR